MTNPKHHKNMTDITLDNIGYFIAEQGLDPLVLSRLFKKANFSEEQADTMAEVITKTLAAHEKIITERIGSLEEKNSKNLSDLATKGDLKEIELKLEIVRFELESKMNAMKFDIVKWVAGLMLAQAGLIFTLLKLFTNF